MSKVILSDELKSDLETETQNLLELLVLFFTGDPPGAVTKIKDILKQSKSISDTLFWDNFVCFLAEGELNYEAIRKLSMKLEENGDHRGNAKKIVHAISKVDEPIKAYCIAKLTQSLINDQIERNTYFRLVQIVNRLIGDDLKYLAENVEKSKLEDWDYVDDFLACGLIIDVDGGFSYTRRAYDLVEYGIERGHSVSRPREMPERRVWAVASNDDINAIFKEGE